MFKIEKNVPLPTGPHGNTKYPFASMQVGDSFFADGLPNSARVAAYSAARRHGITLVTKREGTGYRIWRTK